MTKENVIKELYNYLENNINNHKGCLLVFGL